MYIDSDKNMPCYYGVDISQRLYELVTEIDHKKGPMGHFDVLRLHAHVKIYIQDPKQLYLDYRWKRGDSKGFRALKLALERFNE